MKSKCAPSWVTPEKETGFSLVLLSLPGVGQVDEMASVSQLRVRLAQQDWGRRQEEHGNPYPGNRATHKPGPTTIHWMFMGQRKTHGFLLSQTHFFPPCHFLTTAIYFEQCTKYNNKTQAFILNKDAEDNLPRELFWIVILIYLIEFR